MNPPYMFVTTLKGFVFLKMTAAQSEEVVHNVVADTLFGKSNGIDPAVQIRKFLNLH